MATISLRPAYLASAALSGVLFGAGLYISQMVDPLKVLRFLDFGAIPAGGWDPSLGLVMASALAVMFVALRLPGLNTAPLFDVKFHQPEFTQVDTPLVLGSVLFGVGWGMSGLCPGPAVTLVAFWPPDLGLFLAAMFAGSLGGSSVLRALAGKPVPAE